MFNVPKSVEDILARRKLARDSADVLAEVLAVDVAREVAVGCVSRQIMRPRVRKNAKRRNHVIREVQRTHAIMKARAKSGWGFASYCAQDYDIHTGTIRPGTTDPSAGDPLSNSTAAMSSVAWAKSSRRQSSNGLFKPRLVKPRTVLDGTSTIGTISMTGELHMDSASRVSTRISEYLSDGEESSCMESVGNLSLLESEESDGEPTAPGSLRTVPVTKPKPVDSIEGLRRIQAIDFSKIPLQIPPEFSKYKPFKDRSRSRQVENQVNELRQNLGAAVRTVKIHQLDTSSDNGRKVDHIAVNPCYEVIAIVSSEKGTVSLYAVKEIYLKSTQKTSSWPMGQVNLNGICSTAVWSKCGRILYTLLEDNIIKVWRYDKTVIPNVTGRFSEYVFFGGPQNEEVGSTHLKLKRSYSAPISLVGMIDLSLSKADMKELGDLKINYNESLKVDKLVPTLDTNIFGSCPSLLAIYSNGLISKINNSLDIIEGMTSVISQAQKRHKKLAAPHSLLVGHINTKVIHVQTYANSATGNPEIATIDDTFRVALWTSSDARLLVKSKPTATRRLYGPKLCAQIGFERITLGGVVRNSEKLIYRPKIKGFFSKQKPVGSLAKFHKLPLPSNLQKTQPTEQYGTFEFYNHYLNSENIYKLELDENRQLKAAYKYEADYFEIATQTLDRFREVLRDPDAPQICYICMEYRFWGAPTLLVHAIDLEKRTAVGKQVLIKCKTAKNVSMTVIKHFRLLVQSNNDIKIYSMYTGTPLASIPHDYGNYSPFALELSMSKRTVYIMSREAVWTMQIRNNDTVCNAYARRAMPLHGVHTKELQAMKERSTKSVQASHDIRNLHIKRYCQNYLDSLLPMVVMREKANAGTQSSQYPIKFVANPNQPRKTNKS